MRQEGKLAALPAAFEEYRGRASALCSDLSEHDDVTHNAGRVPVARCTPEDIYATGFAVFNQGIDAADKGIGTPEGQNRLTSGRTARTTPEASHATKTVRAITSTFLPSAAHISCRKRKTNATRLQIEFDNFRKVDCCHFYEHSKE